MVQFFDTVKDVSHNYKRYDKWEQAQADKMAKKEYLVKALNVPQDKLNLTQKKAQTVIRATEIMDTRSENNCENVEQVVSMVAGIPAFALLMGQFPAINVLEKHLNKKLRIEQDEIKKIIKSTTSREAQESAAKKFNQLSNKIQKNVSKASNIISYGTIGLIFLTSIGMILWGNSQQKQASRIGRFQAKQDELKDIENFVVYTPEQLEQAKKIAQTMPDKKEKNGLSQAIQELKEMQRDRGAYKKWYKHKDPYELEKLKSRNLSPEQIAKGNEDKELITNTVAEINIKAEEFSENLENAYDTIGVLSFLLAAPLGFGLNSLLSKFTKMSSMKSKLISGMVALFTTIGISMAGTLEQKNASRIGRYQARKDLINNPSKLMSFTNKEMEQAEHIRAPKQKKGIFEKIGESFKFLKNYYKQKKEYKNYKENIQKYNEKMQEAFKHIEITNAQKAEAKALQANVFRAFDEVDEMSQRYSEDIEATTEIAKTTISNLWQLGWMGATALLTVGVLKGKISLLKPAKWANNIILDSKSPIGKTFSTLIETISKKDKSTRQEFQRLLFGNKKKLQKFLENPNNKDIKVASENLFVEIDNVRKKGIEKLMDSQEKKSATQVYMELLNEQARQTRFAKWGRNLAIDVLKLKTVTTAKNAGITIPKEMQEELGLSLSKYKNYKTLWNTSIIAGIPILAPLFVVPYTVNAFLTDIQKKAGKIGVMKAMERIDDPKIFADDSV